MAVLPESHAGWFHTRAATGGPDQPAENTLCPRHPRIGFGRHRRVILLPEIDALARFGSRASLLRPKPPAGRRLAATGCTQEPF